MVFRKMFLLSLTLSVSARAEPAFVASVLTAVVSSSRSFLTASRTDADWKGMRMGNQVKALVAT